VETNPKYYEDVLMGSISRKINRKKEKNSKKDLQKKLGMFGRLADECLMCQRAFDKESEEEVKSWFVVVRKEQNKVNLYCPPCWAEAQAMIESMVSDLKEGKNVV